jgi:protoheme IX farnesyltransferase
MSQPLSSEPMGVPPSSPAGAVPETAARGGGRALAADLAELVKSRIAGMVAVTCAAGFVLGSPAGIDGVLLAHALIGTALVAMAGGALNQVLEREVDARMRRTADRPIPGGRIGADAALALGVLLALTGLAQLAIAVNLLTALLGAATLAGYLFVYTPLKRVSSLATVVGAVPGAMPPVMGWTAARGELDAGAWALFGILFLWQLPHFLAIAWMYRDDYARGGFPLITVHDADGRRTGRQAVLWAAALVPVSLAPAALGLSGAVFFVGALALSLAFFGFAVAFQRVRSHGAARRLLLVSVLYLPAILAVMLADRAAP